MDFSQLLIIAAALAGMAVVGLLAIVPTLIEIPHRHEPAPRRPGSAGRHRPPPRHH